MAKCIPDLLIEGSKSFYFNLHHIQNIETGHHSAIVENVNLDTFSKNHIYELWRNVFPTFILKDVKAFTSIYIISKI